MDIILKDILIGKANGLEEANNEKFENLFYTGNCKYQQLSENPDKFIISGRKGTGKTILAKYFEKEMNKAGKSTRMLTTREVVLKMFLEKGNQELERREVELFVEYVILTELANIILENKNKFIQWKCLPKSYKVLKYLRELGKIMKERSKADNYVLSGYSTSQQESYNSSAQISDIDKRSSLSSSVATSAGVEKNYVKSPYYNLIDNLKRNVFYLLQFVPANLIFDDLDEFDDRIEGNRSLIKFLNVFIETSHQLNADIRGKNIKDSRIIILLRSDIIKILNGEASNLNKIMADCEIRLNWIKKVGHGEVHPLMDLLATKIKKSNSKLENYSTQEIIDNFFGGTVNGVPIIDHMLNCSFGRPRDIINMLNIIKETYPEATSFKPEYFVRTQLEYSIKFIDELRNEMASYYEPQKTEECFDIIKRMGKDTFWLSDVENILSDSEDEWLYFSNAKEFVKVAYEFGIIGNTWPKTKSKGDRIKYNFAWKYREDGFDNPDYEKKFYVHLALRKSLLR